MNPKREVVESLRVFALRPQVLHSQSSHSQVNVRSSALMKGTAGLTRPTTHKTAVLRVEGGPYGPEPAQVYLLVSFQTPFLFGGLLTRCSCKTVDEFTSPLDPQGQNWEDTQTKSKYTHNIFRIIQFNASKLRQKACNNSALSGVLPQFPPLSGEDPTAIPSQIQPMSKSKSTNTVYHVTIV